MNDHLRLPVLDDAAMLARVAALPFVRGECAEWLTPCRLTACRYHLEPSAKIKVIRWKLDTIYTRWWHNRPRLKVWLLRQAKIKMLRRTRAIELVSATGEVLERMAPSCALDVADAGDTGLREMAPLMGISREGVRIGIERVVRHLRKPLLEHASGAVPIVKRSVHEDIAAALEAGDLSLREFCEATGWTIHWVRKQLVKLIGAGKVVVKTRVAKDTTVYALAGRAKAFDHRSVRLRLLDELGCNDIRLAEFAERNGLRLDNVKKQMQGLVRDGQAVVKTKAAGTKPAVYSNVEK
jgi:hypothetical protein